MTTANGSPSARLSALHAQHLLDPEHPRDPIRRARERELHDPPLGVATTALELVLDRPEVLEPLAHRLGGDEPAEALTGGDEPLLAHDLEGAAHRHPAGAEPGRQLRLARQQRPGRARRRQVAQLGGDLLVADPPHRDGRSCQDPRAEGLMVVLTCIRVVYIGTERKPPRHHLHKGNS